MAIRGAGVPDRVRISGHDPVFSTHYRTAETSAAVQGAIGTAVSDIWELETGRRQEVRVDVRSAGAALRSYTYLRCRDPDGGLRPFPTSALAERAYRISQPWPTRDGRWFLPHFGITHLKEKVLAVLGCKDTPEAVAAAVGRWEAGALEEAIADAGACGGVVRNNEEWLAHPHGRALAAQPVVEIEKVGESAPEPFPVGSRPLSGIRVLDLTRILAGPVAARTLAEQGADVLMVAKRGAPQIKTFVIDLSHGKRSCYLDLTGRSERARLRSLVAGADVFSQGYRPGVLAARGFGPEALAEIRPGIVHATISCFGQHGPFRERAGWEQVAQAVVGICDDSGERRPALLPVPACDYLTGYLAAYGILLALARRAVEGGSYTVNASLCQSGMLLYRQGRVAFTGEGTELAPEEIEALSMESATAYGTLRHLAPVIEYSETPGRWNRPSPALGSDRPEWLPRGAA